MIGKTNSCLGGAGGTVRGKLTVTGDLSAGEVLSNSGLTQALCVCSLSNVNDAKKYCTVKMVWGEGGWFTFLLVNGTKMQVCQIAPNTVKAGGTTWQTVETASATGTVGVTVQAAMATKSDGSVDSEHWIIKVGNNGGNVTCSLIPLRPCEIVAIENTAS